MINITLVLLCVIMLVAGCLAGKLSQLMKIQADQALDLCHYIKTLNRDHGELIHEQNELLYEVERLQGKIDKILECSRLEERMQISLATRDKFEDYMRNVDRLNQMINEFKGLVAIVRGETKMRNE